ncbi:MAG: AtpZ/AtpI family protein [Vicinamibacterales bacterium]
MTSSRDPRTLKMLGQLSTLGLAFVFALVMGFAAGNWLDRRLGTSPWLSLIGFALGLAAGVLNVVRTMRVVNAAPPPADGHGDGGGPVGR